MSYVVTIALTALAVVIAIGYVARKYPDKVDGVLRELRDIHKPF